MLHSKFYKTPIFVLALALVSGASVLLTEQSLNLFPTNLQVKKIKGLKLFFLLFKYFNNLIDFFKLIYLVLCFAYVWAVAIISATLI